MYIYIYIYKERDIYTLFIFAARASARMRSAHRAAYRTTRRLRSPSSVIGASGRAEHFGPGAAQRAAPSPAPPLPPRRVGRSVAPRAGAAAGRRERSRPAPKGDAWCESTV